MKTVPVEALALFLLAFPLESQGKIGKLQWREERRSTVEQTKFIFNTIQQLFGREK